MKSWPNRLILCFGIQSHVPSCWAALASTEPISLIHKLKYGIMTQIRNRECSESAMEWHRISAFTRFQQVGSKCSKYQIFNGSFFLSIFSFFRCDPRNTTIRNHFGVLYTVDAMALPQINESESLGMGPWNLHFTRSPR